ncbi:hypothetical protein COLO4_17750 [Corchorus olitorius]|uniref:DUF7792 domain-containing protein n=1 Tax=Corchorus olitorius TaxID=93759 RepID=A0A1R3JBM4_9ROSI|nr:hypothetical protein COLO4_17750 [Corchorus olitorius]
MQFKQKQTIKNHLSDMILLANQVSQAVDQAKSFKLNCKEMGLKVYQLSQMLETLLLFITLNPILFYSNSIRPLIIQVSETLQEALTLACTCKRRGIFCRLFTGTKANSCFHKLYHLLDVSIFNMNWILILYNPDFGSVFNEIFLWLPPILINDPSIISTWSRLITEKMIWELANMLAGETSPIGLKICCVEALSMLNVGKILNGRMIKETQLLMLGLAKLIEGEHNEVLKRNYLMTIVEITAAAESDLDLSCKAFKTNSHNATVIVEELFRVIKESEDPSMQVLAIRSIGSLARTFCERKNRHVINVLVSQLESRHQEVATEAVMALKKFACPGNFLRQVHSKTMIEFKALKALVKLLRDGGETQQVEGLVLICYIAVNTADYSEAMEKARVVTLIHELTDKRGGTIVSQNPELKELVTQALRSLYLYKY